MSKLCDHHLNDPKKGKGFNGSNLDLVSLRVGKKEVHQGLES